VNKKTGWKWWTGVAVCLLILLAFAVWGAFGYYQHLLSPADPQNKNPVAVTIPSGSSVSDIGRILEKKGLVQKAWAFEFYAKWNHLNTYKSGTYTFNRAMSVNNLMDSLEKGRHHDLVYLIDVRQGMWISEIADRMAKVSGLKKSEILNDLRNPDYVKSHYMERFPFLTEEILKRGNIYPLEGYLAPGVYRFKKTKKPLTLDQMIDPMLEETGKTAERYESQIKKGQLGSLHKVLTLASLVEQEAPGEQDRRKIAGVFYNRLNKNMRLESDTTVIYGRQKRSRDYSLKDIRQDNAFNTYTRTGLPVGPIGSPATNAIEAVLNPVKSDNLFFYARPNGKIYYSKSFAGHQKIVDKYRQEWAKEQP
jgi:UPF0755 protein